MDDFRGIVSFPEAICIVPVVLFAWGPVLILMVSARAICRAIRRRSQGIARTNRDCPSAPE